MCSQMLWLRKRNIKLKSCRLCPEGKPLFYQCIHRWHGWTRIETRTSLCIFRGKLGWFPQSRQQSDRKQTWYVMFRLTLVFLLVLLTQLGALEEEAVLLSAGRDVQDEGCSQCCTNMALGEKVSKWAVEEREVLPLASALRTWLGADCVCLFFMFIWNCCIAGY